MFKEVNRIDYEMATSNVNSSEQSEAGETFTVLRNNQPVVPVGKQMKEDMSLEKTGNQSSSETCGGLELRDISEVKRGEAGEGTMKRKMPHHQDSTDEMTGRSQAQEDVEDDSFTEGWRYERTLTDVESLPIYYATTGEGRGGKGETRGPHVRGCDCRGGPSPGTAGDKGWFRKSSISPQDFEKYRHGSINRYNSSHIQLQNKTSGRNWFNNLWPKSKKKHKHKNMYIFGGEPFKHKSKHDSSTVRDSSSNKKNQPQSDSGETLPELYKAKMKKLANFHDMFKFKAVKYKCRDAMTSYSCQCEPENRISDYNKYSKLNNRFSTIWPEGNSPIENNDRNCTHFKSYQERGQPSMPVFGIDPVNLRACLNIDGTKYVSTNELPHTIDIYCFDHLNTCYFRTTDHPPPIMTDKAIRATEEKATRFWAEIFGILHIGVAFIVAFLLQLYKFLLFSLFRPLVSGLAQLTSDYFVKPLLTILYNGFIQPVFVFSFNVTTSFRDICYPIARGIGYFIAEFALLLQAIRIVEWNPQHRSKTTKDTSC